MKVQPSQVIAWIALGSSSLYGQIPVQAFNPISSEANGIHLHSASISSSYSSSAYGSGLMGLATEATQPHVVQLQGSGVFGWARRAEKANVSILYSPSYVRAFRASSYTSLNHSLSLSAGRTLGAKWSLNGSASGLLTDFQQLVFAQSQYGNLSAVSSTFDELLAAMLTGRTTNIGLTQTISGAPLLSSPEGAFLYGGRLFSTSASASLSYAYSSRSTFSGSVQAGRSQTINNDRIVDSATPRSAIPSTSSGGVNLGWSYSLTPRTTMGASLSSSRVFSSFQDAYSSSVNISMSRAMTTHWFVQGSVGAGKITPIRDTFGPSRNVQQQFGAGTGYKLHAHTFVASYSRSVSDTYGLGANATEGSTAAWTWKRPGRGVSVSGSYGYSRLIGPAFPTSGSWSAQVGLSRALNNHLVMSAGGSYAQYPRSIFLNGPGSVLTGVNISLSWSPSERR